MSWSSFANSPDYFHSCATALGFAPPNAMWGYQVPHSGGAYASLVTYSSSPNYREIIGDSLLTTLTIGQKYFFSFFVNYAFEPLASGLAINKNCLRFSTIPFSTLNPTPINNFAQFHTDSIISDTLIWFKMSGSFIADSAYNFVMIGNFYQDSLTDTIHVGTAFPDYSMYYIDDVCVSTDSIYNDTGTGVENISSNNGFVKTFPNPFSNQLTFTSADNEQTTILLYDFLSRKILQKTFTNSTTVNTEQFPSGIYFYELRNAEKIISNGKLIKQ